MSSYMLASNLQIIEHNTQEKRDLNDRLERIEKIMSAQTALLDAIFNVIENMQVRLPHPPARKRF